MPDFSPIITQAYLRILERRPDAGGLASWNRSMNEGLSEAAGRGQGWLGQRQAARAERAALPEVATMPDFTPIVSDAYREILGRAPDPGGLDGWNRSMKG